MPGLLLTAEQRKTQADNGGRNKPDTNSEWCFSFRGGWGSDSDSSDEEVGHSRNTAHTDARAKGSSSQPVNKDNTNTNSYVNARNGRKDAEVRGGESEEARMLRELDIASRAERDTAQFKATPWSIARVNAAVSRDRAPPPPPPPASMASSAISTKKGKERVPRREGGSEVADAKRTLNFERQSTQGTPSSSVDMMRTEPAPAGPCSSGRAAGSDAKEAVKTPKLGKTIERFFSVRKLGKRNSDRKLSAPYINNRRIQSTSVPDMYSSFGSPRGATLNPPYTPSDRSQSGSSQIVLHVDPPLDQEQINAYARRVSTMPTSSNIHQPSQSNVEVVSKGSADTSADYVSFMSSSNDVEPLDGSVAHGEEIGNFICDAPLHNPANASLERAPANQTLYEDTPSIYTDAEPFVDIPGACVASPARSAVVQPRYQLTNSLSRLSRDSLSSPAIRENFGLKKSSSTTGIRSAMELSPDNGAANTIPRLDSMRYARQEVVRPAYMQSFSSPIRVSTRNTRRSGRAALGLEPLESDNSHSNSQSIQMRRSQSPLSTGPPVGGFVPHFLDAPLMSSRQSNQPEPVQDCTYIRSQPVEEEYNYEADLSLLDPAQKISIPTYKAPCMQGYSSPRSSFPPSRTLVDGLHPSKRSRYPTPRESDAYDAFADDDEASWSTLPQCKKLRTQHSYEASSRTGTGAKSMRQSGRFKLPIALPSLAAKSVSSESTSMGKKRVVTYLPPPRDTGPVPRSTSGRLDGISARPSRSPLPLPETRDGPGVTQYAAVKDSPVKVMKPVSEWSIKRIGNQYSYRPGAPTNARSVNTTSPSVQSELRSSGVKTTNEAKSAWGGSDPQSELRSRSSSPVRKRAREMDVSRGRGLKELGTPSDEQADAALCHSSSKVRKSTREDRSNSYESNGRIEDGEEDGGREDISIALDTDALEYSYPQVRKAMLERRAASSAVWDDLGLPSCGFPFVDDNATSTSASVNKQYEVAIVVWNGLSTNDSSLRRD